MAATTRRAKADDPATVAEPPALNEVRLHGRVAAAPEERELPSGDTVVTLRLVVRRDDAAARGRPRAEGATPRATVDTIDVACWSAATRRAALRLAAGDHVEVQGSLRRRFFGGPGGPRSRYEVEARGVRRLARPVSRAVSRGVSPPASRGVAKGGAAPS